MAKQTAPREISTGICRFCQEEFAKNKMTRHLKSCPARLTSAAMTERRGQRLFHLLVEGKYRPNYWMHLEVPVAMTLADLDDFLRTVWLECCGHLSEFEIDDVSYSSEHEENWNASFGGLSLVGATEEEEEEESNAPNMEEIASEMSRQLSAAFQADLKDVPVEQIEEKLAQLFAENLPSGTSAATLPMLRPLLNYMAESLHQGTLAQDLVAEEEDDEGEGMDVELGTALGVGKVFSYIYDFGSSTTLSCRVIDERRGVLPADEDAGDELEEEDEDEDRLAIFIMARNEPPALVCHICGQPATHIASSTEYASLAETALCDAHSKKADYPDELLPLVNSPRTGVCGYTGEYEDDAWEEVEWDDEDDT